MIRLALFSAILVLLIVRLWPVRRVAYAWAVKGLGRAPKQQSRHMTAITSFLILLRLIWNSLEPKT